MGEGPVYDNALKFLAATELASLCGWLGVPVDPRAVRLSEELPAQTMHADLVVRVGGRQLLHVEFVSSPSSDLPWRLLSYRTRLMGQYPGVAVRQHVLVLATGRVAPVLRDGNDLLMRVTVVYLRRTDPGDLLADPALAPLAVLGRAASRGQRVELLRAALAVIRSRAAPERVEPLAAATLVLAAIYLDPDTIEAARREARMPITLEGTVAGRIIEQRAEKRGEERGEKRGKKRGKKLGRKLVLIAALERRFGSDPRIPVVARGLAELPAAQALDRIETAGSLDDVGSDERSG